MYKIIRANAKTYDVVENDGTKKYKITKKGTPVCFSVVNTESGKVHAKCTTLALAKAQVRLLYGIENGMKLRLKKKPMEEGAGVMGTKLTWREYFAKETKGRKFKNRAEINDHMRLLAIEYKKMKE